MSGSPEKLAAGPSVPTDEPPRRDPPRFRETALASGLIDESQLAAAEASLRGVLDPDTASRSDWDQAVADKLVAEKLLTSFQAREILAGRRRFRLGQYTVLSEVARGGMGQVFRAEHAMMGREVAIKVLPRSKSTPESEAAFRREMRMLGRLDHENLVRAYDAGYDAMVYYLVTELVPGLDLKRQVLKHGPLDETLAASVISQAARGLAYAHQEGLVHRDVKPGNLLVMPDGRVKVLDLGLAGSQLEEESSRLGRVVGTMDYIAPEQIRMPDDVGPSADIYALGCTLYFAVTGQVPFPGGTRREKMQRHLSHEPPAVRELAGHLSGEFCRVIEAMMAKDPADRLPSADAVVERLKPWTPATPPPMPRRKGSRKQASGSGEPPPLPDEQSRGGGLLQRWMRSDAAHSSRDPQDDAFPWLLPDEAATTAPQPPPLPPANDLFQRLDLRRLGRELGRAAIFAGIMATVFAGTMYAVEQIDPAKFRQLLFGLGPIPLGLLAFLILIVAQFLAARPHRRARR
jgi:serine/threonine protein kinase